MFEMLLGEESNRMLYISRKKVLICMLAVVLMIAGAALAITKATPVFAQNESNMGMGNPPTMPAKPGNGGMPMMGMMPPMSSITAAGGYVYVVQGNTLYQFSGKTRKLVNKAEFMPRPPMR